MNFKAYLFCLSVPAREAFAQRCGTSAAHLRNIAYGKTCGEALAIAIDRESGAQVTVEELRPDVDWAYLRGPRMGPEAQAVVVPVGAGARHE